MMNEQGYMGLRQFCIEAALRTPYETDTKLIATAGEIFKFMTKAQKDAKDRAADARTEVIVPQ